MSAISKPPAEREAAIKAINELPADATDQYKLIEALAKANDDLAVARKKAVGYELGKVPADVLKENYDAQQAFDAAQDALKASNVDASQFQALLAAADNPKNTDAQAELAGRASRQVSRGRKP